MYVLRIEHLVPDFDGWKRAFDSDPAGRQKSGVRRYSISRASDDRNFVLIDLEFDTAAEAEALLTAMRLIWTRVAGTVIRSPQARIVEVVESRQY